MNPRLTMSDNGMMDLLPSCTDDHMRARLVPGRVWVRINESWRYPLNVETLGMLRASMPSLEVDERIVEALGRVDERARRVAALKDGPVDTTDHGMPIKAVPYEHQVRAFRIAMELLAS